MSRAVIGADVELRRPGPDGPYDLVQASFKSEDGLDFTVFVQPQNNPPETWDKLGYPRQFLEAGITRDAFEKLARAIVKGKTVLVWNAEHEKSYLPFLTELSVDGRPICDVQDLMWWASPLVTREWSWKYGTWKFAKMTAAAEEFRLTYDAPGPHDAGADASMLLKIYKKLNQLEPSYKVRDEFSGLRLAYDDSDERVKDWEDNDQLPF